MTRRELARTAFVLALVIGLPVALIYAQAPDRAVVTLAVWGGMVVGIFLLFAGLVWLLRRNGLATESTRRSVLVLSPPLQALVGASMFAVTVPMVIYIFWSHWPLTTYALIGAGIFVVYVAAFALGLMKPYRRQALGLSRRPRFCKPAQVVSSQPLIQSFLLRGRRHLSRRRAGTVSELLQRSI